MAGGAAPIRRPLDLEGLLAARGRRRRQLAGALAVAVLGVILLAAGRLVEPRRAPGSQTGGARTVASPQPGQPASPAGQPSAASAALDPVAYEQRLEAALEAILSQVAGVGRVAVHVTLESGSRTVLGQNLTTRTRTSTERDAAGGTRTVTETDESQNLVVVRPGGQGGGEGPVVQELYLPRIRGVLVVAEGAFDPSVRGRLFRALTAYLDVPAHRIQVLPMQGGK